MNYFIVGGTSQPLTSKHSQILSVWLQFYLASELFILTDSADRTEAFTQSVDDFSLRQGAVHTFIPMVCSCLFLFFQQLLTRHLNHKPIPSVFKIYVRIFFSQHIHLFNCISRVFSSSQQLQKQCTGWYIYPAVPT